MSDEEIRREYRQAKDPKKQLKILADENDCSVSTIRNIVSAPAAPPIDLKGFIPIQDLAAAQPSKLEKSETEEKNMNGIGRENTVPTAEPEWPPLPPAKPEAAADFDDAEQPHPAVELRWFLTGAQLSELWFILGKLEGVLEASAAAGKPSEVMKDAVDELESLLRSLN